MAQIISPNTFNGPVIVKDKLIPPQKGNTGKVLSTTGRTLKWIPSSSVTPSPLTRTDDTNITLTLTGTPATSLLQAVNIAAGWTGTLADGRIASATNWNTAYTNRITSLTTTGTSGAATLIANILNIPQYSATTRLDQILAATATNTIANANYAQVWNWDTLTTQAALQVSSTSITSGSLLKLTSTSTVGNASKMLEISSTGSNTTTNKTNYGVHATVGHYNGGGNTDIAGYFLAGSYGDASIVYGVQGIAGYNGGNANTSAGGYFQNTTGRSGNSTNYGVYASNTSSRGGLNSYGGYFLNSAAVNTLSAGVYSVEGTDGNQTHYGGYFSTGVGFGVSATASYYGVRGVANATNASSTAYGGYFEATGSGNKYGTISMGGNSGFGTTTPNSTVQISGSFAAAYIAKTANYTLTSSDRLVNCTANSFTITLPTAVGITGREYIIKNTGTATTITIATTSSQTIDGLIPSTYNVTTLTPLRVMSDGANWITC